MTFNGQIYGIPFAVENIVLFRNTDLAPDAPTTIEDMVATGKELKAERQGHRDHGAAGRARTATPYHIYPLFTSGGGYLFGTDAERRLRPEGPRLAKPEAARGDEKIGALGEKGEGVLKRSISGDNALSLFTGKKTRVHGHRAVAARRASTRPASSTTSRPIPAFAGGKPASPFIRSTRVRRQQGQEQDGRPGVRDELLHPPDVAVALYKADPRPPALIEASTRSRRSDPHIAEGRRRRQGAATSCPAIPEMAAVWDPLGKAEAAVVGGRRPGVHDRPRPPTAIQAQIK